MFLCLPALYWVFSDCNKSFDTSGMLDTCWTNGGKIRVREWEKVYLELVTLISYLNG